MDDFTPSRPETMPDPQQMLINDLRQSLNRANEERENALQTKATYSKMVEVVSEKNRHLEHEMAEVREENKKVLSMAREARLESAEMADKMHDCAMQWQAKFEKLKEQGGAEQAKAAESVARLQEELAERGGQVSSGVAALASTNRRLHAELVEARSASVFADQAAVVRENLVKKETAQRYSELTSALAVSQTKLSHSQQTFARTKQELEERCTALEVEVSKRDEDLARLQQAKLVVEQAAHNTTRQYREEQEVAKSTMAEFERLVSEGELAVAEAVKRGEENSRALADSKDAEIEHLRHSLTKAENRLQEVVKARADEVLQMQTRIHQFQEEAATKVKKAEDAAAAAKADAIKHKEAAVQANKKRNDAVGEVNQKWEERVVELENALEERSTQLTETQDKLIQSMAAVGRVADQRQHSSEVARSTSVNRSDEETNAALLRLSQLQNEVSHLQDQLSKALQRGLEAEDKLLREVEASQAAQDRADAEMLAVKAQFEADRNAILRERDLALQECTTKYAAEQKRASALAEECETTMRSHNQRILELQLGHENQEGAEASGSPQRDEVGSKRRRGRK